MNPGRMKLVVFLPAMIALVGFMAVLLSACINLMVEPSALQAGTGTNRPAQPRVPPPAIPVQLASLGSSSYHRVIFTYYDGSAMQTWAIKTVAYPDSTLKEFPARNPSLPGQVFVRWIHADTSTDPVSYPEFTSATTVIGDMEVRAYHQALPTLSYDSNGGSGPAPSSVSVSKAGEAVRLAGQGEMTAPEGTAFGGWYELEWTGSAYVQTGHYRAGELHQLGYSTTLHARWDTLP